jgi:carbon-monoxide dehydrogenase small subunit
MHHLRRELHWLDRAHDRGFDDDAVMAELREAFSAEHALQCGYCTPGMLVTARDIVTRIPDADENCIRKELAGNLCRCTGYVGIVRAIQRVLVARGGKAEASAQAVHGSTPLPLRSPRTQPPAPPEHPLSPPSGERLKEGSRSERGKQEPQAALHQTFRVTHPRHKVWDFFGRLNEVTTCLPGASVTSMPSPERVDFTMRVKVGPIAPEFEGTAQVERDASSYSGVIHGSAKDRRSSSSTRGEIRYVLIEEQGGAATRVDIDVAFSLTGALAQFSRSRIVQDIATRMTAAFAKNLEARLDELQPTVRELDAGSLVFSAVWQRIKASLRSLFGR